MTTPTPSWVMTYDSLISTVLQYLERSDQATIDAIPTFITLAEFEIASEIKTLGQLQVAESTLTAGNPVVAKPARWRKTTSMNYIDAAGVRHPIFVRKYEYLTNFGLTIPRQRLLSFMQILIGITGIWLLLLIKIMRLKCFTMSAFNH